MRKSGRAKLEWVVPGDALGSTIEPPRPRPSALKEPSPEGLVLDLKADQICGRMECPEIAICGRLPVGKGFLDGNAVLVGAAICPACCCGALRWPLAIMLSADQVPVKNTQS